MHFRRRDGWTAHLFPGLVLLRKNLLERLGPRKILGGQFRVFVVVDREGIMFFSQSCGAAPSTFRIILRCLGIPESRNQRERNNLLGQALSSRQ
jgi:hypothetical protein